MSLAACPSCILHTIAGKLDCATDLLAFAAVSKRTRATAYAEDLWQRLCYAKGYLPSSPPPSWRALYRFNRELLQALLTQHTFEQRANLPALRLGLRVFV